MPDLDIRTLLIVTALISMGSSVALVYLWRSQTQPNGSGFWASGMSCIAAASILITERGNIPDFLSLVCANSLYIIGFVLILRGIRVFTDSPPLLFFDFVLPPIATLLFYYFNYIDQNLNIRIIVISSGFAMICFAIVQTLLSDKNASWRSAGLATATLFGLFGISHAFRGAVAVLSPFEHTFMSPSISSSIVFLGGIFILGGSAIALILLTQATLEAKLRIVSLAVEHTASSVIITDTTGSIRYVNPALTEKTGYLLTELIGKKPRILRSGETSPEEYASLWKTLTAGNTWRGVFHNRKKNGELFWETASISPVKQTNGCISHYVAVQEDITALKNAEERILHMANHDMLTGLATLRLAKDRLIRALAVAKRNKTKVAIFFIDLDGFKAVNDTLGHNAGDLVLKETATRLSSSIREVDTVARVGGDEFWILLTEIHDKDSVKIVAEKVVKAVSTPYKAESIDVNISASIGISLYPDHGSDSQKLVELADQAMYVTKRQGKNSYAFADTVIHSNSELPTEKSPEVLALLNSDPVE
ncbi:diguanylate cyclase [uncultured Amphritea sp.]|uniref:diguanylate cyclase domain-containing protein n=1 Tax=Amphritea sp. TaxID=1872502 RepID=UPI0025F1741B|nr:diguanylate cyclase [uncultured Amphritea sp.]